jgi:acetyl-CoA carboxylase carboxyltransferase component
MNKTFQSTWKTKQEKAFKGGDDVHIERQIKSGKQTARQRIASLLDPDSFKEIDQLARSPYLSKEFYTDGVVTGFGMVGGKQIAVYAQDFTIKGGSLGKRHAEKICKVMNMAAKIGCPIVGIIDSGGARIDEGIHALVGYGQIFKNNVHYSGVIPQISLILGPCAGGAAYSPALTDIVFMTKTISNMFITGPQVIAQAVHQTITKEDLGGAEVHGQISGVAHVITESEEEMLTKAKQLLALLPSNYLDQTTNFEKTSSPFPYAENLQDLLPEDKTKSYDMKQIISAIIDYDSFFEIHELFAPNIIVGFARFDGTTVGIVANQPLVKAGTIDINASVKAARFVTLCNNFDIPIVTLVDVPGYLPGVEQEHDGIIRHGAKLLYAYANATSPKITVILRKAFGGAYIVMGSKGLGADFNFAWPNAEIAVLGAKGAVAILHGKKIMCENNENTRKALQKKLEKDYQTQHLNPFVAAENGYIDAIIEPNETRQQLIDALTITKNKVELLPKKKSGNIPL